MWCDTDLTRLLSPFPFIRKTYGQVSNPNSNYPLFKSQSRAAKRQWSFSPVILHLRHPFTLPHQIIPFLRSQNWDKRVIRAHSAIRRYLTLGSCLLCLFGTRDNRSNLFSFGSVREVLITGAWVAFYGKTRVTRSSFTGKQDRCGPSQESSWWQFWRYLSYSFPLLQR